MNLIKKSKVRKNLSEMKNVNNMLVNVFDSLIEKYSIKDEKDLETIINCKNHIGNVNLVFDSMLNGLDMKK